MKRTSLILLSIFLLVLTISSCGGKTEKSVSEKPVAESKPEEPVAESEQSAAGAAPSEVSFAAQVAPIFAAKCNICHHPDNAVEVDLTQPFDPEVGIINRQNSWTQSSKKLLIVPGDPEASALIWKVEQTELEHKIDGDPMPWIIPALTDRELENLRQWILQGAKDDTLYRNTITRIFGDGVSLGSRGGKCSYCHYPGAAFGPDLSDPFETNRGAVGAASMYGGTRIVPGDPEASVLFTKVRGGPLPQNLGRPMPLHFERLSARETQILRDWISEGAKDN